MTTFMEPDDFDRFEDDGYTGYSIDSYLGFGDGYTDAFYTGSDYDPDMYDEDSEMELETDG